ncbi:DUF930 domain-containing protein [Pseudomonas sp. IT-196MI5]|uniref:hypothetical protein n=1 Tax=Pseudomonas sp. IT-196MI5 TaxID=3026440 RepID=UPI0039E05161
MRNGVLFLLLLAVGSAQAETTEVYLLKEKARELVRARLKDPDAAKFQKLEPHKLDNGATIICGEVNSKNGYGGYTGFEKFFSTGSSVRFKADSPSTFEGVYQAVCSK